MYWMFGNANPTLRGSRCKAGLEKGAIGVLLGDNVLDVS